MCIGESTLPTWIYLVQEVSGLGAIILLNILLSRKTNWYKKYKWSIIALSIIIVYIWTAITLASLFSKTKCI